MEPELRAALVVAVLAAVGRTAPSQAEPASGPGRPPSRSAGQSPCPPGQLPDGEVCIPVPLGAAGGEELLARANAHRVRSGEWRSYEQIPRRPERAADYRRYRWPIPIGAAQSFVTSGYDLDLPDADQRRGEHLHAVGHGGVDIAGARGTEARLVALENQQGDAEVILVGELFGNSVVTRHSVKEGGKLREYVIIYGHLDAPAPGIARGTPLREGQLVGFVGDSGSPGDVHLHVEVRRVRDGVSIGTVPAGKITDQANSVVCDPRNVLPRRD